MKYTIGADDLRRILSWVDASYAVHPDMRSHTGGTISLGRGGLLCKSTKQKLNTRSSTEAEFVGASDYLPNTIWAKNFLQAQGYAINENVFEQDNESAMKLEKNGRMSAGPKSQHIDIRYFWIRDRIRQECITIRHCPTLQMVADFFTKPLQGNLFRKLRDVIMGKEHMDSLDTTVLPPLIEERVENTVRSSYGTSHDNVGTLTDVGTDDSFILVQGKKQRARPTERTWSDVVLSGRNATNVTGMQTKEVCFKSILLKQSNKYRE